MQENPNITLMPSSNTLEKFLGVEPGTLPKQCLIGLLGATNGMLYFFVAAAGTNNIIKIFHLEKNSPGMLSFLYLTGIGSSIIYSAFYFKMLKNVSCLPKETSSRMLALCTFFTGSTFLISSIEGATYMGINKDPAVGLGIIMYLGRMVMLLDGAAKFPDNARKLMLQMTASFQHCDYKDMLRMLITLYTALGYSVSSTDSVCAATALLLEACGIKDQPTICYVFGTLGALGLFPTAYYWAKRGFNQLSHGGVTTGDEKTKEITDWHSVAGAIGSIPVMAGCLGTVTGSSGDMFGRLGLFSSIVRVTSASLYAVISGVNGLSPIFRKSAPRCLSFFSKHNNEAEERAKLCSVQVEHQ